MSRMNYQAKHTKKSTKQTNFRTWKSGKNWLYGASLLTAVAVGTVAAPEMMNNQTEAFAAVVSSQTKTSNPTDTSVSNASNANLSSEASDIHSTTSAASGALSSAVDVAKGAGINVNQSVGSSVNISLADGSSYATSVANSVVNNANSQASSLISQASSAASAKSSYSDLSSAISSINSSAKSEAANSQAAIQSAVDSAKSAANNIAGYVTSNDETVTPSYVTSAANSEAVSSAASYNSSLYSSAVNSAMSEASSQANSLSSVFSSMNPSSAGNWNILQSETLIGSGTAKSGFVQNASEADSSAPIVISGNGTVASGTYGTDQYIHTGNSSYPVWWGSASDLATTGTYVVSGLKKGDSVSKTWSNIGTLNGQSLNLNVTFTVDTIQDSNKSNTYLALSNNVNTFVSSSNFNGHFTVSYTWVDSGKQLTIAELDQLAFLAASLSYNTNNVREYMTTSDSKDVILSNNSQYPSNVSMVNVDSNNLGLPDNLDNVFESTQLTAAADDNDFNNYANLYGATFMNHTTSTPTFYFGDATTSGSVAKADANHLEFFTETAPFNVVISNPNVAAPELVTPDAPDLGSSDVVTNPINVTAKAPTIDAPQTSTGKVNTPFDLTQNNLVTGDDNGNTIVYNHDNTSHVTVTVTDPSGKTVTTDGNTFTPGTSGSYKVTYTYTSENGTATTTTTVNVKAPISGGKDSIWLTIGNEPKNAGHVTNTVVAGTGATINNVTVGKITDPSGKETNLLTVTVDPNDPNKLTVVQNQPNTPTGNYTIPVTYTDTDGNTITIMDNIAIATGANGVTTVNKPVTVNNADVNQYGDVTKIVVNSVTNVETGENLPINLVSVSNNGDVTLDGVPNTGIYRVNLTYTGSTPNTQTGNNQVIVNDTIIVGKGASNLTSTDKSVSLTNTIPTMKGSDVTDASHDNGTVSKVTGPNGVTVPNVTIGADGKIVFPAGTKAGDYTVTVNYVQTWTDTNGTHSQTMQVLDHVLVINGDKTTVWVNQNATTNNNTPSGLTIQTIGDVTGPDGVTLPSTSVTVNPDGSLTLAGQPKVGVYTVPVTYVDANGNTATVYDIITVLAKEVVKTPTPKGTDLVNNNYGKSPVRVAGSSKTSLLSVNRGGQTTTPTAKSLTTLPETGDGASMTTVIAGLAILGTAAALKGLRRKRK